MFYGGESHLVNVLAMDYKSRFYASLFGVNMVSYSNLNNKIVELRKSCDWYTMDNHINIDDLSGLVYTLRLQGQALRQALKIHSLSNMYASYHIHSLFESVRTKSTSWICLRLVKFLELWVVEDCILVLPVGHKALLFPPRIYLCFYKVPSFLLISEAATAGGLMLRGIWDAYTLCRFSF